MKPGWAVAAFLSVGSLFAAENGSTVTIKKFVIGPIYTTQHIDPNHYDFCEHPGTYDVNGNGFTVEIQSHTGINKNGASYTDSSCVLHDLAGWNIVNQEEGAYPDFYRPDLAAGQANWRPVNHLFLSSDLSHLFDPSGSWWGTPPRITTAETDLAVRFNFDGSLRRHRAPANQQAPSVYDGSGSLKKGAQTAPTLTAPVKANTAD